MGLRRWEVGLALSAEAMSAQLQEAPLAVAVLPLLQTRAAAMP